MNISAITNSSGAWPTDGANQTDFRTRMEQSMAPVANLLGMSTSDLMNAVRQSGGSLSDYAASKGVSQTDLIAAIKQGLQDNAPAGVQLSDNQLTNLANRIANHKPGDHQRGPRPVDSGGCTGTTQGTSDASTLKTDLEKLISDLKTAETSSTDPTNSGTSSTDLLTLLTQFDAQL